VAANAHDLPFRALSFDVVILDAVLEHIPDVGRAFSQIARVLKIGGVMVGYSAFMECFHEISYSHLSFKALEYYAAQNGMRLEAISGGGAFGIDYHLAILAHPVPFATARRIIAACIRGVIRAKSMIARLALRRARGLSAGDAAELADLYYKVECLRQSNGFSFVIRRTN
jgi:SAM-dependent methyltransferase